MADARQKATVNDKKNENKSIQAEFYMCMRLSGKKIRCESTPLYAM